MSLADKLKFDDKGLIPAIAVDADNGEVLMMAYMNAESVEQTVKTGKVHYYSRSRQALWCKGESSGHFQYLKSLKFDCDADCVLVEIEQVGAACHTGQRSCFYREWDGETGAAKEVSEKIVDVTAKYAEKDILDAVYHVIQERKQEGGEKSYVKSLFEKGLDKILGKLGEEATETAVAGKGGDRDEVVYEATDLIFHLLVLLAYYDLPPERIYAELRRRFGLSGIEEKDSRDK